MFRSIRQWFDPHEVRQVGSPPTTGSRWPTNGLFWPGSAIALALVAGGLAAAQFLPPMPIPHLREAIASALLLLGGAVALRAVDH